MYTKETLVKFLMKKAKLCRKVAAKERAQAAEEKDSIIKHGLLQDAQAQIYFAMAYESLVISIKSGSDIIE